MCTHVGAYTLAEYDSHQLQKLLLYHTINAVVLNVFVVTISQLSATASILQLYQKTKC